MSNHRPSPKLMRSNYAYRRLAIQHAELDEIIDHLEQHDANLATRDAEVVRLKKERLRLADQLARLETAHRRQVH